MDTVRSRRSILLFSDRIKIEELYLDWVKKNGVADKPNSVVAFLQAHNWLNEEKIVEDLDFMDLMKKEEMAVTIPAADVVPVVRCKECKHWKQLERMKLYGDCPYSGLHMDDYFCTDAEKR